MYVGERSRHVLESPNLPLTEREVVVCRIVVPFFGGRVLWAVSASDWFNCCFSEERLIALASAAIALAAADGWERYVAEGWLKQFHAARE